MIKKILLIYPPLPMLARYSKGLEKIGATLPPLGLLSIGAALEDKGYEVRVHDSDLEMSTIAQILDHIKEFKPEFIGIYSTTANNNNVLSYAGQIKAICSVPLCLGGPHPTIEPEKVLLNDHIDLVVIGEGEVTIIELLVALSGSRDLRGIKGIGYKNSCGEIILNSPRELIHDLDNLPMPARHLVPIEKYRPSPHHYLHLPSTNVITSRGCPFDCTFCASRSVWGRTWRVRSVDKVIEEIKLLIDKYAVRDVNFWDDLWGLRREWVVEFCRKMIEQKLNISWSCERRVDTVDLEILKLMKKAGCYSIFYGVESFDQECLDAINKDINARKAEEVISLTKESGIEVRANFIIGLPKDTPEKMKKTVRRIIELNPDYVKFNIMTPYPGTPLYQQVKSGQWGFFSEDSDRATGYFATFLPFGYKSFEELEASRRYAFRKFHLRPRYIYDRLTKIRSLSDVNKYWNGFRAVIKI